MPNTTVTSGTNANGGAEYKVAVNKDLVEMRALLTSAKQLIMCVLVSIKTVLASSTVAKISAFHYKGIQIGNTDTLEQAKFDKYGMYASEGNTTVYYTTNGISAGDQKINNVKAGVADTDAVNVSQQTFTRSKSQHLLVLQL